MTTPRSSRRPILRVLTVAAGLGILALLATVGVELSSRSRSSNAAATAPSTASATVERENLVEAVTVDGEVGYGAAIPLAVKLPGTFTWLPSPETVIRRGHSVVRVDDAPVVLLYGSLPMYRPLAAGLEGRDVRQFEENLEALGYGGYTVDDRYTAATVTAVKRWQHDLGLVETGTVEVGRVVYAIGPVRVASDSVRLGDAAPAEALSVTGTRRFVMATVPAGSASWAVPGTRVRVHYRDGTDTRGTVADTGPTAFPTGTNDASPESSSSGADSAAAASATTTVVTVVLANPAVGDRSDHASVRLTHVVREHRGVLTVPVVALLALAEGGYGLEVLDVQGNRIIPVETGMFAGGRVEVRSPLLRAGQRVGMPA
jgi:peptidoglycan hydrolase-like protein with peptidoglycan-binding domain